MPDVIISEISVDINIGWTFINKSSKYWRINIRDNLTSKGSYDAGLLLADSTCDMAWVYDRRSFLPAFLVDFLS